MDAEISKVVGRVRSFAAEAKASGISVAIGSAGATKGESVPPSLIRRILADVPDVRLALDAGNRHFADRPSDALQLASDVNGRIAHVDLRDWDGDGSFEVTIGVGRAPNMALVRALSAGGYDGWYTLAGVIGDAYLGICRQVSLIRWWRSQTGETKVRRFGSTTQHKKEAI